MKVDTSLYKRLSRNSKLTGWASFFTDISSEMMFPLLPIFMKTYLGASALVIGVMDGMAKLMVAILKVISGYISDSKHIRKQLLIFGYGISAITKPLFGFISTWQQGVLLRLIERSGKGIRGTPRDALIAETEKRSLIPEAMGFRKMMDSLGATLGPIITGILLMFFKGESGMRLIFIIASIPAFIALIFIMLLKEDGSKKPVKTSLKAVIGIKGYVPFLIATAIFSLFFFSNAFAILKSNEVMDARMVSIAYFLFNIVFALSAVPVAELTKKIGEKYVMLLGFIVYAMGMIIMGWANTWILPFISFPLIGISYAIYETVPRIYIVKMAKDGEYAFSIGVFQGITTALMLIANVFAGLTWNTYIYGIRATFILPLVGIILSAPILLKER